MPISPSDPPRRALVMRLVPLRKAPMLSVVVPDRVETASGPYIRPAHMAPPSGPSLYLAPEDVLAG